MMKLRACVRLILGVKGLVLVGGFSALAVGETGPSTTNAPYLNSDLGGVTVKSILTVADTVPRTSNGTQTYRMVGIPDGLGAYHNGDGTFTLLVNHEIQDNQGVARAHGSVGSFVSKWIIDTNTHAVLSGDDLIQQLHAWDGATYVATNAALDRLCSADLPAATALFNGATGRGTTARLHLNGEESDAAGRALAHVTSGPDTGKSYFLPHLGIAAIENVLLCPVAQDKTIAILTDDDTDGQVYVYVGNKTNGAATAVQNAGLTGGMLYGVKVNGKAFELGANGGNGPLATNETFALAAVNGGNVIGLSGAQVESASDAAGILQFGGPEDGAWDVRPGHSNIFYFNTKGSTSGGLEAPTRLWKLEFTDIAQPELGGTLTMLLDAAKPGPRLASLDNMTMVGTKLYLQEDRGSDPTLCPVWEYDVATGAIEQIATHEARYFFPGGSNFITANEESSGIIPLTGILGEGWFAASIQVHASAHLPPGTAAEVVEGGQLVLLHLDPATRQHDFPRETLSARGSAWKYEVSGADPGATWKDTGFDDAAWPVGTAELGYGDGDEVTAFGAVPPVVTYFRQQFVVSNATEVAALELFLKRDDGAVVYLNGQEIARTLVSPAVAAGHATTASSSAADEANWVFAPVRCEAALVEGTNTLAVSIHQAVPNGGDHSFDLELIALRQSPDAGSPPATPTGLSAVETTSGVLTVQWLSQTNARTYQVERRKSTDVAWSVLTTDLPGTIHSYVDNVGDSGTFLYRVGALNIHGASGWSTNVSAATSVIFGEAFATQAGFDRFLLLNRGITNKTWSWTASFGSLAVGNSFISAGSNLGTNEDWLITPAMDFTAFKAITLGFTTISRFYDYGPDGTNNTPDDVLGFQVLISTDFNPLVHTDPNTATWTDLTSLAALDLNFDSFGSGVDSGPVDLSAYKTATSVRVAFVYRSTSTGSNRARAWELDNVNVTGVPLGQVQVNFSAAPRFNLPGSSITFTSSIAGAAGAVNYLWNFGDGATSTSAVPSHVYAGAGRYTVSLGATDGVGDSGTNTKPEYVVITTGGVPAKAGHLRVATFNSSLYRSAQGQLITDLSTTNSLAARRVAEIIQRVNPDVVLINEFDYDAAGQAARLFRSNYLEVTQAAGVSPVSYPYYFVDESNTGIHSGFDLDNDGVTDNTPGDEAYGDDAFGFGEFAGKYGLLLLSKYPIVTNQIRTFQFFRWQDMPGALLPDNAGTGTPNDWYSPAELGVFRLSSKSHWDVPVNFAGHLTHFLVSHPTPPVFDGAEDRNGKRNHDEIRLWADYVNPAAPNYLYDDAGVTNGLGANRRFVILGDQNADPVDGDSTAGAIQQLLTNAAVDVTFSPESDGAEQDVPVSATLPRQKTSTFNLRADYVLPSTWGWQIVNGGHFWPIQAEPTRPLLNASDHRLVWLDLDLTYEASRYSEWVEAYGHTGIGGTASDPDGDELLNEGERLWLGDPNAFEANRGVLALTDVTGDQVRYEFTYLNHPGVTWKIITSTTLVTWSDAVAGVDYQIISAAPTTVDPNGVTVTIEVTLGAGPGRFWRAVITEN